MESELYIEVMYMMQKENKRGLKGFAMIGSSIGIVMVFVGVMMVMFDDVRAAFPFPNIKSAPWGFVMVGILIVIVSIAPYVEEINKTKQQRIEDQDERNHFILYQSSYFAFSFLMGIGGIALLLLTMLGYMNQVSFFTICTIFILSYIFHLLVQYHLKKKM